VTLASTSAIDVSGATGGGTVQVGGGPHGGGTLKHATTTTVAQGATIKANATKQGNGGNVAVWSDGLTTFNGSIEAKGAGTGNGGWVETSGHYLSIATGMVDASAPNGAAGTWLLDPYSLDVVSGGTDNSSTNTYTSSTGGTTVYDSDINASLAFENVTLQTGGAGGNITVDTGAALTWSGSEHLTLDATANGGTGNIAINGTITAPSGTLSLKSTGTISQQNPMTVDALELLGGASVTLNYSNAISTLAGSVSYLYLANTTPLTIGTAGSTTGLTSTGTASIYGSGSSANILVQAPITATGTSSSITLSTPGAITVAANITTSGGLDLTAGAAEAISISPSVAASGSYFDLFGGSIAIGNNATLSGTSGNGSYLVAQQTYSGSGTIPFTLGTGAAVSVANSTLYMNADEVSIAGTINVGTGTLDLGPYNTGVTMVLGSSGINPGGNTLDLTVAGLAAITAANLELGSGYYGTAPAAVTTEANLNFGSTALTIDGGPVTIANSITAAALTLYNASNTNTMAPYAVQLSSGGSITTTAGAITIETSGTGGDISLQGTLTAGGTSSGSPQGTIYIEGDNVTIGGAVNANSSITVYSSAALSVNAAVTAGTQLDLSASGTTSSLSIGPGVSVSGTGFSLGGGTISIGANATVSATASSGSNIVATATYTGSNTILFTLGTGASITTANGSLYLTADEVSIAGTITTGTGPIYVGPYNSGVVLTLGASGINSAGSHLDLTSAELADLVSGTLEFGYGYYGYYDATSITTAADLNFGSAAVTFAEGQITINNNVTAGSFTISSAQSSNSQPAISLASGKTITTTAGGISMTAYGSDYDVLLQGALVASGGTTSSPTGSVYVSGANVTVAGGVTANSGVTVYGNTSIAINSNIAAGGPIYLSATDTVPLTIANGVSLSGLSFDLYGGSIAIGSNVSLTATGAGYSSEITTYSSYSGSGTVPLTIGSGSAITTANGALYVTADEVSLGGTINVGTAELAIGPYNSGVSMVLGASGINPSGSHLDITAAALANMTAGTIEFGDGYYYYDAATSLTTAADLNFGSAAVVLANSTITINNNITAGAFTISDATTGSATQPVAVTLASGKTITTTAGGISIYGYGTGDDLSLQGALVAGGTNSGGSALGSISLSGGNISIGGNIQANGSLAVNASAALTIGSGLSLSASEFTLTGTTVAIGANTAVAGTTADYYNQVAASAAYSGGTVPFTLGSGASLTSNGGAISIAADEVSIGGPINAGAGTIYIGPYNSGITMVLGASGINSAGGSLDLTAAELAEFTAANLNLGYGYYDYYSEPAAVTTAADLNFGAANVVIEGGSVTLNNNITAGSFSIYNAENSNGSSAAITLAAGKTITATAGEIYMYATESGGDILIQGALVANGVDGSGNGLGSIYLDGNNVTVAATGSLQSNNTLSLYADAGNVTIAGPVSVTGAGYLEFYATGSVLIDAAVTASGTSGAYIAANYDSNTSGALSFGNGGSLTLNGEGTLYINGDYYTLLTSASDLSTVSATGYYALANNIDASSLGSFTPIGNAAPTSNSASTSFAGTFNGLGHVISNLAVSSAASNDLGLFGAIGAAGTVSNLGLVGGAVIGSVGQGFSDVGLLAGTNAGTITNAYATGSVTGDVAGMLVGYNDGSISSAYASGTVNGSLRIGGLVGYNHAGTITNAFSTSTVTGAAGAQYVGGLVGDNGGTITAAYAAGAVSAGSGASSVGGLVGNNTGTVTYGYWDTQATGQSSSAAGTGLTTAQLQSALPAGFDPSAWGIVAGTTYPFLATEQTPSATTLDTITGTATTLTGTVISDGTIAFYADGTAVGTVVTTDASGDYTETISSAVLFAANSTLAASLTAGGSVSAVTYADGLNLVNNTYSGFNLVSGETRISTSLSKLSSATAAVTAAVPTSVLSSYASSVATPALALSATSGLAVDQSLGSGPLSLAGTFKFSAPQDFSGQALTLTGTTVLDSSASNSALTLGTVDGGFALTLNAGTAAVAFKGAAGAQTALASLTINAGTITLGNVTTSGAQIYNGATTLNGTYIGSSFTANGIDLLGGATGVMATAGNITFGGTLDGAQGLTLTDNGGTVTFGGTVGGSTGLGSLTVTAGGIVAGSVTTAGAQSYGGALTLSSTPTIQSVNSDLTFGGTINGTSSLTLSAGGNIVFDGTLATQANRTGLSILKAQNVTVLNNSTLWVASFSGTASGTFDFGNHSLESDDVVTIQAGSVDGRVISTTSATIDASTVSGIIQGSTVNVTATGAVSEQITADSAIVSGGSFSGSVAATRSANVASGGDISADISVSGGGATVSGANVSGSITSAGLAQISASQNVSADVTGGSVAIQAGQNVSGAVTSTGPGGVTIAANNVSSNVVAQGGGPVGITATGSITGSVTGGAVTLTAPVVNENIDAASATINSANQTLDGFIGGAAVGAASNVTQEILGATQQVAANASSADSDEGVATGDATDETEDEKQKKKKSQGPVYDFANQYIDSLIVGKPSKR